MQQALPFVGLRLRQTKTVRRENDYYPTPPPITRALLRRLDIGGRVLEPCAGTGTMAHVLRGDARITAVVTSDIDTKRRADFHGDAARPDAACYQAGPYDWIVTNPPFNVAPPILATAYKQARIGVAFLVRLTFLEPTQARQKDSYPRAQWLRAHADEMSNVMIFNPRPKFRDDKESTDSATVAWLVWRHAHRGGAKFDFVTDWKTAAGEVA